MRPPVALARAGPSLPERSQALATKLAPACRPAPPRRPDGGRLTMRKASEASTLRAHPGAGLRQFAEREGDVDRGQRLARRADRRRLGQHRSPRARRRGRARARGRGRRRSRSSTSSSASSAVEKRIAPAMVWRWMNSASCGGRRKSLADARRHLDEEAKEVVVLDLERLDLGRLDVAGLECRHDLAGVVAQLPGLVEGEVVTRGARIRRRGRAAAGSSARAAPSIRATVRLST